MIESFGFDGVYVSGAVMSAELGLPDIGLTTLTEVAGRSGQIAQMTSLPTIVDADTDRKSTRLNSSHVAISYAVFCLQKKMTAADRRCVALHVAWEHKTRISPFAAAHEH